MAILKKKIGIGRHLSSIKRARQIIKRRKRNKTKLSAMRTFVKRLRVDPTEENLKMTIPLIAKNAQKGIIHKKMASRLISRITKTVNSTPAE